MLAAAVGQAPAGRRAQLLHHARGSAHQQLLALGQQPRHQRFFKRRQAARLQGLRVAGHTGSQCVARRQREHAVGCRTQSQRAVLALALDLPLHLRSAQHGVVQGVDLVQHDEAFQAGLPQMVTPDGQVGPRHAAVSGQHEDDGVRGGQQAKRQFGFRTDGVQAGRVDDDQPALQQWVRIVDERVAPGRHFHAAVCGQRRVVFRVLVVPQAQVLGLLHADALRACDGVQRLRQGLRVQRVQRQALPCGCLQAQFRQGLAGQARFDGQQHQLRRHTSVVAQFHRAHRGAPWCGGQHTPAGVCKEDGVDQLGLAAREFGHEGQHQLVRLQPVAQPGQDGGVVLVQQLVFRQRGAELHQRLVERLPPGCQGVESLCDGMVRSWHGASKAS